MSNSHPYLYLSSTGTILAESPARPGRPPRGLETREIDGKTFFVIRNCIPHDGISDYDDKLYTALSILDSTNPILVPRKDRNSKNPAGGVYNDVLRGTMEKPIYEKSLAVAERFASPKASVGPSLEILATI